MGFDAVFELVVDGTNGGVAFEFFEGLFDFGELEVVFPKFSRIAAAQIRAQQITSFTAAGQTQFLAIKVAGERDGLFFSFAVD